MMLVTVDAAAVVVAVTVDFRGSMCGKVYICLSKWAPAFADERALLVSSPRRLFGLGFRVGAFLSLWLLYIMSSETLLYVECNRLEPFRLMIARWKEKMT